MGQELLLTWDKNKNKNTDNKANGRFHPSSTESGIVLAFRSSLAGSRDVDRGTRMGEVSSTDVCAEVRAERAIKFRRVVWVSNK